MRCSSPGQALEIPSYFGGMARGLLGNANKQLPTCQFIHNRKDALKEADLVLLAGSISLIPFIICNLTLNHRCFPINSCINRLFQIIFLMPMLATDVLKEFQSIFDLDTGAASVRNAR